MFLAVSENLCCGCSLPVFLCVKDTEEGAEKEIKDYWDGEPNNVPAITRCTLDEYDSCWRDQAHIIDLRSG